MKTKFDTTQNSQNYLMTVAGCNVGLNAPEALKSLGKGDDEIAQELPPFRPRAAFLVDEYPACPAHWPRSEGRIKSYFVPIIEDHGMWLDFNHCLRDIPQDVAIVVSIQGVNAVTGLPCRDAALEQYLDQCPKHKKPFGPDRLCKECGYKWPKQNYLSSTGTPHGSLWLDGFRAADGKVRQYVFTANQARSVAKAIIGEDRVFALGISFFLSKTMRPKPASNPLRGWSGLSPSGLAQHIADSSLEDGGATWDTMMVGSSLNDDGVKSLMPTHETSWTGSPKFSCSTDAQQINALNTDRCYDAKTVPGVRRRIATANAVQARCSHPVKVKSLEVAPGARINQRVWDDPNTLEFWNSEPAGLIVINYCSEAEAEAIIAAGKVDVNGSPEGFLQNIPTGNP